MFDLTRHKVLSVSTAPGIHTRKRISEIKKPCAAYSMSLVAPDCPLRSGNDENAPADLDMLSYVQCDRTLLGARRGMPAPCARDW